MSRKQGPPGVRGPVGPAGGIKIFNLWGGPQEGAPPSGATWPANGILHYSLYTGS